VKLQAFYRSLESQAMCTSLFTSDALRPAVFQRVVKKRSGYDFQGSRSREEA